MLDDFEDEGILNKYKEFNRIREKIKSKSDIQTPSPARIDEAIELLNTILNYQENLKWTDELVKRRNEGQSLVYGDENYIVLMPASVQEVIDEAFTRNMYLINYLFSYINGSVNILFLRLVSHMNEPYVSLIVRDGCIENIYDQNGRLPCISVIDFIEKRYSKVMGLKVNPWEIIICAFEDMDFSEGYTGQHLQELEAYAEEYKTKHGLVEELDYIG